MTPQTPNNTTLSADSAALAERRKRGGTWVIGLLFLGSIVIGVVSYVQFMRSEELLHKDFEAMRARGAALAVDQCVDEVIDWHRTCGAMGVLCDKSVGRMMEMCLDGRDRTGYCSQVDLSDTKTSSYGYNECKARGMHEGKKRRKKKKVCGTAYRAVAYHCEQIQQKAEPQSTAEVLK